MPNAEGPRTGPSFDFLARLGDEARRRRKDAGLTVQQLADTAGLSRRMLTQIELGQANPSLVTVDKLAAALHTDFVSLTRDTQPETLAVNAPGAGAGVWTSTAGSRGTLQIATQHQPPAELWEWTLTPGDRYQAEPDPAGSEELFLVIEGALTLEIEGMEPITVEAEGSARLASDRRYAYVNNASIPTRFVRVVQLGL